MLVFFEHLLNLFPNVSSSVKARWIMLLSDFCSPSKICAANHRIMLDDDGSYIQHKQTSQKTEIWKKNGVYVMNFWIEPAKSKQTFHRQGR